HLRRGDGLCWKIATHAPREETEGALPLKPRLGRQATVYAVAVEEDRERWAGSGVPVLVPIEQGAEHRPVVWREDPFATVFLFQHVGDVVVKRLLFLVRARPTALLFLVLLDRSVGSHGGTRDGGSGLGELLLYLSGDAQGFPLGNARIGRAETFGDDGGAGEEL